MKKQGIKKIKNVKLYIAIDEVGRGPIAGPVTIGIFAVPSHNLNYVYAYLDGITDSKQLTETQRNKYRNKVVELVTQGFCRYQVVSVSARIIDARGITVALRQAIQQGMKKIKSFYLSEFSNIENESFVFLDGGLSVSPEWNQETIIKGDARNWLIGAASVVAKVHRDSLMFRYDKKYPAYLFASHKGYGTRAHYQKIREHGTCKIHRKTWISQ